jgi:hypothetical protein
MPAKSRKVTKAKNNTGCCLFVLFTLLFRFTIFVFEIMIKAIIYLVKFLFQVVVSTYNYLKENPIARRNVVIGGAILLYVTMMYTLCISTLTFVKGIIPTSMPTITFTQTLTTTPTLTLSPTNTPTQTITLTPTISHTPTITSTPTITLTPTTTPTSTPSRTNTPKAPANGFVLIYVDGTTSTGGVAEATVRTQPGTQCKLTFVLPSGRESSVDGVGTTTADKDGYCSWWWEIKGNVKPGKGAIVITAGGQTTIYSIKIE